MANFIIGPIVDADITLSPWIKALVRLEFKIVRVAQFLLVLSYQIVLSSSVRLV